MRIGGIQKMTLIDFPGKIATTVFTVGCSFRCGFCHNPELVLPEKFPKLNKMEIEFFDLLEKRKGKLEGVCITGGEPTIQPDIIEFIRKIKALGYAVKLDSNGTNFKVLEKIYKEKLVDYVAMDIKSSKENYLEVSGMDPIKHKALLDNVKKSVKLIMSSGVPYEFRTTVVPGIHSEKDFIEIAKWIKNAQAYYLQEYREMITLDPELPTKTRNKSIDLEKLKTLMLPYIENIGIRMNN